MFCKYSSLCFFSILTCHVTSIVGRVAIVGGDRASIHQFPYQVAVMIHPGSYLCGGGILNEYFILSAAHCVLNDKDQLDAEVVSVLAGTIALNATNVEPTAFIRVHRIYIPTEYKSPTNKASGDIAVFKLENPLDMVKHNLQPLRLPDDHHHESFNRKIGKIAGFGLHYMDVKNGEEEGGHHDKFLRYALADVLNTYQCQHDYPENGITDKHICARIQQQHGKERGVCIGDSGGPLVIDHHTVIGILTIGPIGCSEERQSGVYTRVSHYVSFIIHAMKEESHKDIRAFQLP